MKPETRFRSSKVRPFLKKLKHTKFFSVQQLSINGTPDMLLCVQGLFVALELKAEGGEATVLQLEELKQVTRCGGLSLIASPENWEEIKLILSVLDEGDQREQRKYTSNQIQLP